VVASGKGGTGKTTLSALFARFAAEKSPPVVADCDVEASNLPLALGADIARREPFPGLDKAVVDEDLCIGCDACRESCRFDAISTSFDGTARIDEWSCEGCGACLPTCPEGAIAMEPRQAGELVSGRSSTGPIVFGRLRPGQDLSGKLVTAVRERAEAVAEEAGAELVLVDGPPGIGCPVIASISGADELVAVAEPSLSGEHDLRRLVALARQLRVPVSVVLNKADLSPGAAERLRETCRDEGLSMIGEVPFDEELPAALEQMAAGEAGAPADESPGGRAAREIWKRLREVERTEPNDPGRPLLQISKLRSD
jgi:MinD superfamily P-loop ATPase